MTQNLLTFDEMKRDAILLCSQYWAQ